jgi:hypothetical protein
VNGVSALVVRMKQQLETRGDAPVPGQPARAVTRLAGEEDGFFLFAPQPGRLLARRREGRLAGDLVLQSGGGEMTFKQEYSYTNTLDAVR